MFMYGELVLLAESLLMLSSEYAAKGKLDEQHARDYRQILGFYMYTCTPEESIPDFTHAVLTIGSHLKGIA